MVTDFNYTKIPMKQAERVNKKMPKMTRPRWTLKQTVRYSFASASDKFRFQVNKIMWCQMERNYFILLSFQVVKTL